ncbi:thiamine-phosphate kinase [Geomicrobium sp. JCM 19055]|uniref:thiamine-phosphate kinase n=1 Tax=Geomicrobium sp. JCM 19055 TaxID=1460649 RepID=UPI00045ED93F|nr:thiamine-phosphate kinase [Geomicrobium sp. JCM 19055]GAK01274.1 thiamine-monophosphate kinase [Geomicrobium sp. JCM 19055]
MDEFGLINKIQRLENVNHSSTKVGIGDDAAVFTPTSGKDIVTCVDTLTEGVHFTRETMKPSDIGYKALAVNISDIAAMGAIPVYYLVTIAVPKDWTDDEILAIYEGMQQLASNENVQLIGGDSVTSKEGLYLSVTVIGEVDCGRARLRSHAEVGDVVFVTGDLGGSAAGLHQLLEGENVEEHWKAAHQKPAMHTALAYEISRLPWRIALNDISDGLASESWEIAESSHVQIELIEEEIPLSAGLVEHFGQQKAIEMALTGGEDFQLLGTVARDNWQPLQTIAKEIGERVTKIGTVIHKGEGVVMTSHDQTTLLSRDGYKHG